MTRPARCLLSALALSLCLTRFVEAAEEVDETQHWLPGFSIDAGMLLQGADAASSSGDIMGPPLDPNLPGGGVLLGGAGQPIRPPAEGDSFIPGAFVGGSVELMTPALLQDYGRPRVFAQGGVAGLFGQTHDVAKEGNPGAYDLPPLNPEDPRPPTTFPESTIQGQGSRTRVETESVIVSAGAGVAFTFDWGDRRIRIKPSAQYLWQEYKLEGFTQRAVRIEPGQNTSLDDFRQIRLTDSTTEGYHSIGTGLEIELDVGRAGPFMLSMYVAGAGFGLLGGNRVDLKDTNEYGETADWQVELDRWYGRTSAGLRFRWLPE